MINHRTTLVLGAGASVAFGYPLGWELRKQILDFRKGARQGLIENAGIPEAQLRDFVEAFEQSQMASIDAFLARRPEFGEIGKRTIAALLLDAEAKVKISQSAHEDNWYQYLLNRLLPESWGELDFGNLSIVTFNYDRSFEHYLFVSLQAAYGKSPEEVLEKLAELEVVHIYGTLGPTLPTSPDYLPYGHGVTVGRVTAAAAGIRVIPEGRTTDETLVQARSMLLKAKAIGFLGFGFDPINCERLDIRETCCNVVKLPAITFRDVAATCFGMTSREAFSVFRMLNQKVNSNVTATFPPLFHSTNCVQMLRETLLLGR